MDNQYIADLDSFEKAIQDAHRRAQNGDTSARNSFISRLSEHIQFCQDLINSLGTPSGKSHTSRDALLDPPPSLDLHLGGHGEDSIPTHLTQTPTSASHGSRSSSNLSSPDTNISRHEFAPHNGFVNPAHLFIQRPQDQLPSPSLTPERRRHRCQDPRETLEEETGAQKLRKRDTKKRRLGICQSERSTEEQHDNDSGHMPLEAWFDDVTMPASLVQPFEVAEELGRKCLHGDIGTQLRFFYGIASPDALIGLRNVLTSSSTRTLSLKSSPNALQIIRALDQSESWDCRNVILRRAYLAHLVNLRDALVGSYNQADTSRNTRRKQSESHGKASSKAIEELMEQGYPGLHAGSQTYQRRRDQLKNRLRRGRKWQLLEEKFSSGVLALVPQEGPFACADSSIEDMKEEHFNTVLEMLAQHRGKFIQEVSKRLGEDVTETILGARNDVHFRLQVADEEKFESSLYDSDILVRLCERTSAAV